VTTAAWRGLQGGLLRAPCAAAVVLVQPAPVAEDDARPECARHPASRCSRSTSLYQSSTVLAGKQLRRNAHSLMHVKLMAEKPLLDDAGLCVLAAVHALVKSRHTGGIRYCAEGFTGGVALCAPSSLTFVQMWSRPPRRFQYRECVSAIHCCAFCSMCAACITRGPAASANTQAAGGNMSNLGFDGPAAGARTQVARNQRQPDTCRVDSTLQGFWGLPKGAWYQGASAHPNTGQTNTLTYTAQ
jgi:hypothetical protein